MFFHYRENCKRETKKDIFDWYKPVFDSVHQSKESFQSPKAQSSQRKTSQLPASLKKQRSQSKN